MRKVTAIVLFVAALTGVTVKSATADEVRYWNDVMLRAIRLGATGGPVQPRVAAIMHVAIFDALNGIDQRYTQIRVHNPAPPAGASRRAAVVEAAFISLAKLFPAQYAALLVDRQASLDAIAAVEDAQAIAAGVAWGRQVAMEIIMWRVNDGFNVVPPPVVGGMNPGQWRPTPRPGANPGDPELPGLPMAFVSVATTTPFAIPQPWSYRNAGPPALSSAEYAANVEEVRLVGELNSAVRTADQTTSARFWAGTAIGYWNRAATTESLARQLTLLDNARLFALLNIAAADSAISCWDSKLFFMFWRPITAIRLADTDGNPGTSPFPTWTPLLVTPPYPDYDSGHQSIAGSSYAVLTTFFGANTPVSGTSEGFPGVVRSFPSYVAAADEAFEARIWSGIHYRFAMQSSRDRTAEIVAYVLANVATPLN